MRRMGKSAKLVSFVGLTVLLVTALLATACAAPVPAPPPAPAPAPAPTPAPPPAPKTLKIGVCEALTGFGSEGHVPIWDGEQLAAEWINERGGITINGQQYLIELVVEDGKGTVEGYVAAAKKLVLEHEVKFILGGIETPFHLAIQSVTEPAKVLRAVHYTCGIADELASHTPYTFNTGHSTVEGIFSSMAYLVEAYPEVKTLSMINPGDAAAPHLTDWATKEAEKHGLTVIDSNAWPFDIVDWYPFMTNVLATNPDGLIYSNGWPSHIGGMLKAARELGFTGPLAGANNISPFDALAIAGEEASTNYFANNWSLDTSLPDMPPMLKEMIQISNDKLGSCHPNAIWGWNAVWCMAQAIEHAQSLDPTEVADAWRNMDSMETLLGTAKMGGMEIFGVRQRVQVPMEIAGLWDGEVKHIKWVTLELD